MPPKRKLKDSGDATATKHSKPLSPASVPMLEDQDFSSDAISESGTPWNYKFVSWNVNGIRAWCKRKSNDYFKYEKDPDVIHLQETKCWNIDVPTEAKMAGYHCFWNQADKKGYSSTALLSKVKPIKVTNGIGKKIHDSEGRTITAEYEKFFFVGVYVPNAGRDLVRLDYKIDEWNVDFLKYLENLESKKPVIVCGDFNVAHKEIDLSNPKSNAKSAGFTPQERAGFDDLLGLDANGKPSSDSSLALIDTYRLLNPDVAKSYTFWSAMGGCRAKNIGWRLDYFLISPTLKDSLCASLIRKQVYGSDHCPIVLLLSLGDL